MTFKEFRANRLKQDKSIFGLLFAFQAYFDHYGVSSKTADSILLGIHGYKEERMFNCFLVEAVANKELMSFGPQSLREHFNDSLKMDTSKPIKDFEWIPELKNVPQEDLEKFENYLNKQQ